MANVHQIYISGWIPFDIVHRNETIKTFFANMAGPSFGIRIKYHGPMKCYPNKCGGQTAKYSFEISGDEAISTQSIIDFVRILRENETIISLAWFKDIENDSEIVTIP